MRAMREGEKKSLELEYAALRMGLLRCGYYAGGQEGGQTDEGITQ